MDLAESPYVFVSPDELLAFAERDAAGIVVWLRGEHDASTVDGLWEIVARAIDFDDADVVIDLSGVEFMGSATVGVVNRARDCLRARSRSLTLRAPSRCARRLLGLYNLTDLPDPLPVDLPPALSRKSERSGVAGRAGS